MGRFEFYGQGLPAVEPGELKGKLVVLEGTDGVGRSTHIGLLREWLESQEPGRAKHVLSLIRQSRDGKLNDADFHTRFVGSGPYAELIEQRFQLATKRLGLNRGSWELDTSQFKPPPRAGDQLSLL